MAECILLATRRAPLIECQRRRRRRRRMKGIRWTLHQVSIDWQWMELNRPEEGDNKASSRAAGGRTTTHQRRMRRWRR